MYRIASQLITDSHLKTKPQTLTIHPPYVDSFLFLSLSTGVLYVTNLGSE